MPPTILRFLMMNRNGTRVGKWTWIYLAICAVVLVLNTIFVHILGSLSLADTETPLMIWFLASPAMLLLNRLKSN